VTPQSGLYDDGDMGERRILRGAQITLRRAICERFPPWRERSAWLRWAAGLSKSRAVSSRHIVKSSKGRASHAFPVAEGAVQALPAIADGPFVVEQV